MSATGPRALDDRYWVYMYADLIPALFDTYSVGSGNSLPVTAAPAATSSSESEPHGYSMARFLKEPMLMDRLLAGSSEQACRERMEAVRQQLVILDVKTTGLPPSPPPSPRM